MSNKPLKKVGTHDGKFHADEVMATAMLKELFQIELIRTRDPKILSELDIVYDVGGGKFDHHDTNKIYRNDGIPYASCGLIWSKFGKDIVLSEEPSLDDKGIDAIFNYVDRVLVEGIDAQDNGMKFNDNIIPMMNISSIISGFNPPWYSEYHEDEAFNEVVEIASAILKNTINRKFSVLKSKNNIISAYSKRPIPQLLVLQTFCPFGEILQDIDDKNEVLFVIYPRKDGYAIQTVRGQNGEDRKKLPKAWSGKRDEELSSITGVKDSVFCHSGRFMAVNRTYEGIIQMAQLAINEQEKPSKSKFLELLEKLLKRK